MNNIGCIFTIIQHKINWQNMRTYVLAIMVKLWYTVNIKQKGETQNK